MYTNEQVALIAASQFVSDMVRNLNTSQSYDTIISNVSAYQKAFLDILNSEGATPPAVFHPDDTAPGHAEAKNKAIQWARRMLHEGALFMDFETNGWGDGFPSEIVQVSIVNHEGKVLVDTLVKPEGPIQDQAVRKHGITEDLVTDAPSFQVVWDAMKPALTSEKNLVIYNVDFERGRLYTALKTRHTRLPNYSWEDAMAQYAAFNGEWKADKNDWKFKKLVDACAALGVEVEEKAHSAIGDVLRTLGIVKAMAETDLLPE